LFLHNGWGNEQFALNKWQAAAIFWSFGLIFIILPPVNDWLIKKTNPHYNQPFFWQHFKK
jgi:hypothetical protein